MFFLVLLVHYVFSQGPVVQTTNGPVRGFLSSNAQEWRGIPYAAPPVGPLRWQSTTKPTPWTTPLATTTFQPGCPQNCDLPPHTCPPATSEDCLYINVYAPLNATASSGLTTMVWLHGGHFDQGSGGCDLYDGSTIASTGNVVVVTLSYRLGVLGWLATYDGLTGNYGFQDQIMALQWVQDNIAKFGGNPNQVTLFGQSAGGTSLRAHLVSPYSKGLFHRAITESDPVPLPMQDLADAQEFGTAYLGYINCPNTACLRTQNVSALMAAQLLAEKHINIARPIEVFLPFTPLVDNKFIPYHIFDALATGNFNKVPMIIGTTYQDALLFVYKAIHNYLDTVEYAGIVGAIFLQESLKVMANYPPPLFGDKRPELSILGTDYIFTCSTRAFFEGLYNATRGSVPLYLYQWNHALSWDGWGPSYPYCIGQVCHGAEIPYLWDPPVISQYVNLTAAEKILSNQLILYWTNFAKSGNPNTGIPVNVNWPSWTPTARKNMEFQTPVNVILTDLMTHQCDFWDVLGYHWGW